MVHLREALALMMTADAFKAVYGDQCVKERGLAEGSEEQCNP